MTQTEALKLALERYMAAYGQALEAHGIELQQQQIAADKCAREALAQPEQEHVAIPRFGLNPDNGMMYESERGPWCLYKDVPPQRTWMGLTDEEMAQWIEEEHDVLRWAEAKLREKNT